MRKIKSLLLVTAAVLCSIHLFAQANPSVAILPLNPGGVVPQNAVMDVQVTINNTLSGSIPAAKLRPVITIPSIATILPNAEQTGLPTGWTIVTNAGGQIRVCNATDPMGGNEERNIIIKVRGTTLGGPSICQVQMNYGGTTCGTTGPQPTGNLTVDDFATSSITVTEATVPLNLLSFTGNLVNCQPVLHWKTVDEINTSHFQVEKQDALSGQWTVVGTVPATPNTQGVKTYQYTDRSPLIGDRAFYRLKMIDLDRLYRYSNTIPVSINCNSITAKVFPNPVYDGKLYLGVTGLTNKTEALLVSTNGQVLQRTKVINGTNYIDVKHLAAGTYMIQLTDPAAFNKAWKVIISNR